MSKSLVSKFITMVELRELLDKNPEMNALTLVPFDYETDASAALIDSTKQGDFNYVPFYNAAEPDVLENAHINAIMVRLKQLIDTYTTSLLEYAESTDNVVDGCDRCMKVKGLEGQLLKAAHHSRLMKHNVAPLSFSPYKHTCEACKALGSPFGLKRQAYLDELACRIEEKKVLFNNTRREYLAETTKVADLGVLCAYWVDDETLYKLSS